MASASIRIRPRGEVNPFQLVDGDWLRQALEIGSILRLLKGKAMADLVVARLLKQAALQAGLY